MMLNESAPLSTQNTYASESERDNVFSTLKSCYDNKKCIDCNTPNPSWVSLTFGVFLCLTCSGFHRRMGTHISFVRSSELDQFTPKQLIRMELGGNRKILSFFKSHGKSTVDYNSKISVLYKEKLNREVDERLLDHPIMREHEDSKTQKTVEPEKNTLLIPSESTTQPSYTGTNPKRDTPMALLDSCLYSSGNPENETKDDRYEKILRNRNTRQTTLYSLSTLPTSKSYCLATKLEDSFDFDAFQKKVTQKKSLESQYSISE